MLIRIQCLAIALLSALLSVTLSSCGGGSSGSGASVGIAGTSTISGVAATGAALGNAAIQIRDVNGATVSTTSAADGSYTLDVTTLTAPLVLTATTQLGDAMLRLVSLLAVKPPSGTIGTANLTPLTHALAALVAPSGNPTDLETPAVLRAAATQARIDEAAARIRIVVENLLRDAGVEPAGFDPVSTVFAANRAGVDRVLELVRVDVNGQGVTFTNPVAPDDGNGSASVRLSATTAPGRLPAPPKGTALGQLDHFATLAEACLKDPPAVRAPTRDANGLATSLSAACNAVPFSANYKSGGFTRLQRYGGLFVNGNFTGAIFSKPEMEVTSADGSVEFRMAFKTAAGVGGVISDIARKTNPPGKLYQWEIDGNQCDYDSNVHAKLDNLFQLNPNNTQESSKSHYRVALSLFFNPRDNGGKNVQAVRIKGPPIRRS